MKTRVMYAVFDGQEKLTAWTTQREKAWKNGRRLQKQLRRSLTFHRKVFVEPDAEVAAA